MSRVPRVHNNQYRMSTHDNLPNDLSPRDPTQADSSQDHPVMMGDTKKVNAFPQAVPGLHNGYTFTEMPPADMPRVRPSQNDKYRKSNGPSGLRPRDQKQANTRQVHPEMTNAKFVAFQKADPGLPNKYDEVKAFSTFVPYEGLDTPLTEGRRATHLPYAVEHKIRLTVDNMPFERSETMADDMNVLLSWMSATVVPSWARERGLPGFRQYYLRMAGMSDYDSPTMIDGCGLVAPAKKRHIFAKTNIPIELIGLLLRDPRMYVLADRNGFHACWDPACPPAAVHCDAVKDGTIQSSPDAHKVQRMAAFGNTIRAMGLRARHRFTDGLPCTSVRVDYLPDRKVEGAYAAPYPTSNNRRLTGKHTIE